MDTDLKKDIKVEEDVFGNDKGINGNKRGNSYDQGTFYTFIKCLYKYTHTFVQKHHSDPVIFMTNRC